MMSERELGDRLLKAVRSGQLSQVKYLISQGTLHADWIRTAIQESIEMSGKSSVVICSYLRSLLTKE